MPTSTYTPLANITLGSAAASVTFSSISGLYRDLILVYSAMGTGANRNSTLRINGDTGANYNTVYAVGNGSSAVSSAYANQTIAYLSDSYPDLSFTTLGVNTLQIMDYSATDKHKTFLFRGGNAANNTEMVAGRWASTSAVTSFVVSADGSTFQAGGTFALYGIAA